MFNLLKIIVTVVLIWPISTCAFGQSDKLAKLDQKNGVKNIKLLSPFSSFKGLSPVYHNQSKDDLIMYSNSNETPYIGDIQVHDIHYGFYDNKLYQIDIQFNILNQEKFRAVLTELYGDPKHEKIQGKYHRYTWEGKKVVLELMPERMVYTSSEWGGFEMAIERLNNRKSLKDDL